MEILENGGSSGGFLSGRRGRVLIGLLVVAALLVVAFGEVRRRNRAAAPPAPVDPALISFGGASASQFEQATHDFVLQVELMNHNEARADVRAAAAPDDPGFTRVAVAIVPGFSVGTAPTFDEVAATAGRSVPLDGGSVAQLAIVGRLDCAVPLKDDDVLAVVVGEETVTVTLPPFDGVVWTRYITKHLCRPGR